MTDLEMAKLETRKCSICGNPVRSGMTDEEGSFYVHEGKCFEEYMNRTFGKNQWMALGNNETDEFGGYYIAAANVVGGFQGTGIFWTEWEDDD